MTDIDPKSIPVLDDVIEDDADEQPADEASSTEAVDLFSPASLIDGDSSQAEDSIDYAETPAAAQSDGIESDHAEIDTVADTDIQAELESVSELTDQTDTISARDESILPEADDLYQDDILNEPAADPAAIPVVDPVLAPAGAAQTAPSQQAGINTTAVTEQIIDRLMPEIEQRLRVIIDLTLRENLRDRKQDE